MVVVLPLLLLLFSSHAVGDQHVFTGVDMMSSLTPHAGHRAVILPRKGTWVPLYRHLGPCSPPPSSTGAAKAKPPTLAELLGQDQLRVDHIHRRLSSSSSEHDVVGVSKAQGPMNAPVRFEAIHLHGQPIIQVTMGSERRQDSGGQPAAGVVQTVVLDTASDVPWVRCHPTPAPTDSAVPSSSYDPAKSSTYAAVPCSSAACAELGRLYGDACVKDECQYRVPMPKSSTVPNNSTAWSSAGTYGTDLLAVDPNGAAITFRFGCSRAEQGGGLDNTTAGVMALGGGAQSLVSQTAATYGNAFSYCIPAATERGQPPQAGFFVLGSPAQPNADLSAAGYAVTPMLRYAQVPTLYRVRLLAIAVDGERLNVTPSVFAAGAVLDSLTAITRLPPTAYQALREAFRSRMGMYREAPAGKTNGLLDTCYDFAGAFFVMVPRIALLFEGGAVVELDRPGILFHDCLAFTPNREDRMAGVLGNVQQQTMEVLHNVGGRSVGFRRGAC